MQIDWDKKDNKSVSDWVFGTTNSRFRIDVGPNTEGNFSWVIFHEDFKHAVYGDVADDIGSAKKEAENWLKAMTILGDEKE